MRKAKPTDTPCQRILVIMPRLLGESVMATAALHAIHEAHPGAHITALVKRRHRPLLYGLGCVDRVLSIRKRSKHEGQTHTATKRDSVVRLGRRLSRGGFDTAVIFPLSFKAAALTTVAGIKRRIGYESEGRAVLLTDRLVARHRQSHNIRNATIDSYLAFARYLGSHHPSQAMHQAIHPDASSRLASRLEQAGVDAGDQELLLLNPGGSSATHRWSPRRMAHLCEMLVERFGLTPVVTATPAERAVVEAVIGRTTVPIIDLPELGRDLHLLKAMVARSRMVVTQDTGLRLIAAALDVPALTLFGPTVPQGSGLSVSYDERLGWNGLSIPAKNVPRFKGRPNLDALQADEVFAHASQLYEATRRLSRPAPNPL